MTLTPTQSGQCGRGWGDSTLCVPLWLRPRHAVTKGVAAAERRWPTVGHDSLAVKPSSLRCNADASLAMSHVMSRHASSQVDR